MKQSAHINYKLLKILIVLVAIDLAFFSFVNPTSGSSIIAIVGSLLLSTSIYLVLRVFFSLVGLFFPIRPSSQRRLVLSVTVFLIFLFLMQSIGQLSLRDVLAVLPLVVLLYFYVSYTSGEKVKADR